MEDHLGQEDGGGRMWPNGDMAGALEIKRERMMVQNFKEILMKKHDSEKKKFIYIYMVFPNTLINLK